LKDKIDIVTQNQRDGIPYDLLLIADPSKDNIDKYIWNSAIYKAELNGQPIGYYVLHDVDDVTTEIKNIVVDDKFQGQGIGAYMLNDAIAKSRLKGASKIIIGTGNSSLGQLYLYQKVGFRITEIKKDYFKENYEQPIIENGIECCDLIVLIKVL
jgi:aminoglycoside 6'-N-acetyltransferase I